MHDLQYILAPDEMVVKFQRQHYLVVLGRLFQITIIAAMMIIAANQLQSLAPPTGILSTPAHLVTVAINIARLASIGTAIICCTEMIGWWRTVFVITNYRLIELQGFVRTYMRTSLLDQITHVVLYQTPCGRVFKYGDVEVTTANDVPLRLRSLATPLRFAQSIQAARAERITQASQTGEFCSWSDPPPSIDVYEAITRLHALHQAGSITWSEFEAKKCDLLARI